MKNKRLLFIIALLVVAVACLAYLNYKSMNLSAFQAEKGEIYIKIGDKEANFDMERVKSLPAIEFEAIQDTSDSGPERHDFKGVQFRELLFQLEPSLNAHDIKKVIVKGIDGYSVALSPEEALSDSAVYLAYEKDGKPLGSKKSGGSGPYQLIVKKDAFSMRWCKYVSEVIVE